MGSRLKRLVLVAIVLFSLTAPLQPVSAATNTAKPTPKATPKATAKATAKPTPKATVVPSKKPTAKPTAKPTVSPTKKVTTTPTVKPTTKPTPKPTVKKSVPKKRTKKKVRVTPSPKPVWPPKGFIVNGDVYAKVPTSKELVGIISAQRTLSTQIKSCTDFICGAIQVASETGCIWWEASSEIFNGAGVKLGALTTSHGPTAPREIKTIISVSPESANNGGRAKFTSVICHREQRDASTPLVKYEKVESVVTP